MSRFRMWLLRRRADRAYRRGDHLTAILADLDIIDIEHAKEKSVRYRFASAAFWWAFLALTAFFWGEVFGYALAHEARYEARVVSVYDGDTVVVDVIGLDTVLVYQRVRLLGIQAPEMRPLATREAAIVSRDWLAARLAGQEVVLEVPNDARDSFGRLLGILWVGGSNINAELVAAGMAEEWYP